MPALHQHLQHETAHFTSLSVLCGIVIDDGHVLTALQQPVEVIGVDGHLMVDGGQPEGLAYAIGNKRGVIHALGHVAFVTGEQQHMVKVQVTRLQHTHHLQTLGRFSVEWNGGCPDQLGEQSVQGVEVDVQVPTLHESQQSVDQRVGTEEALRHQGVVLGGGVVVAVGGHDANQLRQPLTHLLRADFIEVGEEQLQSFVKSQLTVRGIVGMAGIQLLAEVLMLA